MLKNIQVLRAIAASWIVIHHLLMGKNGYLLATISKYGFIGLDLFFVISGLVITHTTKGKPRNLGNAYEFLRKRFFRIYLGYWPFFFFTLLIRYIIDPGIVSELNIIPSFFLSSALIFKLVIPVSWSLTYELYFYLLFSISFIIPIKHSKKIFVLLFLSILMINIFYPIKGNLYLCFLLSPYIIEFLAGSLISLYLSECRSKLLMLICILVVITSYYFGFALEAKHDFDTLRLLTFGMGAFFIVFLAVILENIHLNKVPNFIVSLGDSSYPIYLSHLMFILAINASGMTAFITAKGGGLAMDIFSVLLLGPLWIFSVYYYKNIERKLYQKMVASSLFRFSFFNRNLKRPS